MRVYGSSPLYNYVELMFRCKRMFIVAVILGTIITTVIVRSRPVTYDASMLIHLTGQNSVDVISDKQHPNAPSTAAERKLTYLATWIAEYPDFMDAVVKGAQLDIRHPDKTLRQLDDQVRRSLSPPGLITDQDAKIGIVWPVASEAEDILNSLYFRFSNKVVSQETESQSRLVDFLDGEYKKAKVDADAAARARIAYQKDHWFVLPTQLSAAMMRVDTGQNAIQDAKLDLSDAQSRLADIDQQMKNVQKEITSGTTAIQITTDPKLELASQYTDLQNQYKANAARYSPQHPVQVDLQKRMDAIKKQIDDLKNVKPQRSPDTQTQTQTVVNPEYIELKQQRDELQRAVHAQQRRVNELQADVNQAQSRALQMPPQEVASTDVDHKFMMATQFRDNLEARLQAAKFDKQMQTDAHLHEVAEAVPPKAERSETPSKQALLYALGPILGLFVAFCFSLIVETLDHSLRTPVEVEKYLGKPVLAVIPRMRPQDARKRLAGTSTSSISS